MMLAHFKNDWEEIVSGGYDIRHNKEEFLKFRRSLRQQSLNGDYIKSFGEKIIADFLFEHNVTYKYEKNHWWSDINYRPDFTLFLTEKTGVIIEYFGFQGDIDYDAMTQEKRDYWSKNEGWTLIELYLHDITADGQEKFLSRLKVRLQAHGFPCERLSEEEIWQRIKDRAIDQFTKAMRDFIGKCRKFSYTVADLQSEINCYKPLYDSETMFHNLALTLYDAYLNRFKATGEEDFNGLMQRAADSINAGKVSFERKSVNSKLTDLRYLCIDEFQDFSDLFYRLLNAIRVKNPTVELFCVGDDWQAINGFAGSDLQFFQNFTDHIGESTQLYISTNYRSSKAIVTVGNELMNGLGKPAVAHKNLLGSVIVADIEKFTLSTIEKERHSLNKHTPMILRVVNKALVDDFDVVILCRKNPAPKYIDFIRSFFPKELHNRISISTAHKYKGLEKSVVIIPDAFDRSYPLIHPNWIFSRIFGDSPETITEEERRLFYVALTRAINKLVIITETGRASGFLEQLHVSEINWNEYPPVSSEATRLVVKIGNQERRGGAPTYLIRDLLKASNYQFQSTSKTWAKIFPIDGFNIETIKDEVWAKSADGIEVHIVDDADGFVAHFLINSANWHCVANYLGGFVKS
jgi:DNA helicase IV